MNTKLKLISDKYVALRLKTGVAFESWNKNVTSRVGRVLDQVFDINTVKQAQVVVTSAEQEFQDARKHTFGLKKDLENKQMLLKDARTQLDRCSREDSNYLTFVSKEHALLVEEQRLRNMHELSEETERQLFTKYSNAVRVSHERERERAQKTKYISIIGSISGTIIGFLGSSLITYYRFRQIKEIVAPNTITVGFQNLQNDIAEQKSVYKEQVEKIVSDISSSIIQSKRVKDNDVAASEGEFTSNVHDSSHESKNHVQQKMLNNLYEELFSRDIEKLEYRLTECLDGRLSQLQRHFSASVADLMGQRQTNEPNIWQEAHDIRNLNHDSTEPNSTQQTIYSDQMSWRENAQLGISVATLGLLLFSMLSSGTN